MTEINIRVTTTPPATIEVIADPSAYVQEAIAAAEAAEADRIQTGLDAAATAADAAITAVAAAGARYASKAAAEAATVPPEVEFITVLQSGNIIRYQREVGATALVTVGGDTWEYESGVLSENLTLIIPDNYPDMQTAFAKTSVLRCKQNVSIAIRQRTGTPITTGVNLVGGDWSHYNIGSEPSLFDSATNIVNVGASFPANTPIFGFSRCLAPRFAIRVNAQLNANQGIVCRQATLDFTGAPLAGVLNVRQDTPNASPDGVGLFANDGSVIHAPSARFTGSQFRNCHITGASSLKAHNSRWAGAGEFNVFVTRGCHADLSAGVTILNGTMGLVVRRSIVAADGVNVHGASLTAVSVENSSVVNLRGAFIRGTSGASRGVSASRGGKADVTEADIQGAGPGLQLSVINGGIISAKGSTTRAAAPGVPNVGDCSVGSFNAITGDGFIMA